MPSERPRLTTCPIPHDSTGRPEMTRSGHSGDGATRTFRLGRSTTAIARPRRRTQNPVSGDDHGAPRPRTSPEDRLARMLERRCDQFRRLGRAGCRAIEAAEGALTYDDLDMSANRLARFLHGRKVGPGDRIAVLLERPLDALVAQVAVAKLDAVWVPVSPALPDRSLAAVLDASGASLVITRADAASRLDASDVDAVYLDRVAARVDAEDVRRLPDAWRSSPFESPAYIVVHADGAGGGLRVPAIGHQAVTNLVQVVGDLVDIGVNDRVLHDPRVSSDLAVLETWLAWSCGATVVTPPVGADLRGPALGRFLRDRDVTVLRAEPAQLIGIDVDLPRLRLLLVSGVERPREVVNAWQRRGRRLIGLHGPPETTVAAFWSELRPDRAPTLGRPLPTYGVVVLDAHDPRRVLPPGEVGEIGITGVGVARGYVGRADLTRQAFLDPTPAGRVFRSGDLGRITADGEVERVARLDGSGGRGLRELPANAQPPPRPGPRRRSSRTVVFRQPPGAPPAPGTAPRSPRRQPERISPHQAPPRVERASPLRRGGPPSHSQGLAPPAPAAVSAGAPATEAAFSAILTEILGRDTIPPSAHFFDDLGADSLLMARFCAKVRKQPQLPSVAMQDIYQNPTLAALTTALAPSSDRGAGAADIQARLGSDPRRGPEPRDRVADGPLLRRPWRRLAADGPLLRQGPQGPRPAGGRHARHLRPHHTGESGDVPRSGGRTRRTAVDRRRGASLTRLDRPPRRRPGDGPLRRGATPVLPRLHLHRRDLPDLGLRLGHDRDRTRRPLPARRRYRGPGSPRAHRASRDPQVGAGRTMATDLDPGLEPGLPALLDRQGTDQDEPDGDVHRHARLQPLPPCARSEDRSGGRPADPPGPRRHRPVLGRGRHPHPQGRVGLLLPRARRAHRDRWRDPGRERRHRRIDGA